MKKIILLVTSLIFVSLTQVLANDVKISLEPKNPVVGETFRLIFQISTTGSMSNETPDISFDAGKVEVLGRSSGGVSVRTTIIGGQVSTKKEVEYEFEMVANFAGTQRIREIVVNLDGNKLKAKDISFEVLKSRPHTSDMFLLAIPSKRKVYLGEGLDVDYYLYTRLRLAQVPSIKKDPQFGKFIKRFYNVPENPVQETVEFGGKAYHRSLHYSARLYPQETGSFNLGELSLVVQYFDPKSKKGFSFFGFQSSRVKNRMVVSKKSKVEVISLPTKNVPNTFSGLVGKHKVKLSYSKSKFLVNEPIEFKLEVEGPGDLDNFDAPILFNNKNLEVFDSKSRNEKIDNRNVKKIFEYTYLGRNNLVIPERKLEISYFDPTSSSFEQIMVEVPRITVAGGGVINSSNVKPVMQAADVDNEEQEEKAQNVMKEDFIARVLAPEFEAKHISYDWMTILNVFLAVLSFLLLGSVLWRLRGLSKIDTELIGLCNSIKKEGPRYSPIFQLINKLSDSDDVELSLKIEKSALSPDAKKYFSELVNISEKVSYKNTSQSGFKYVDKYFKELVSEVIESRGINT